MYQLDYIVCEHGLHGGASMYNQHVTVLHSLFKLHSATYVNVYYCMINILPNPLTTLL